MMTDQDIRQTHLQHAALACVTIFVLREHNAERELLVLRQPSARPRLPDDTVGADETPEAAALRLAHNYASPLAILRRPLARLSQMLPGDERAVLRPVMPLTAPNIDSTLMRFTLQRGMRVRLTGQEDSYARIVYEEYALHENELAIATRRAGWVAESALTDQIEHHIFYLRAPAPVSPTDTQTAEYHAVSEPNPVWTPLASLSGLVYEHEEWLERARPFLMQVTE